MPRRVAQPVLALGRDDHPRRHEPPPPRHEVRRWSVVFFAFSLLCRWNAIQQAIGELQESYDSAVRNAWEASLDDDYVDEFEASPQNSSFGRKYFSHIQGNIDTCGY